MHTHAQATGTARGDNSCGGIPFTRSGCASEVRAGSIRPFHGWGVAARKDASTVSGLTFISVLPLWPPQRSGGDGGLSANSLPALPALSVSRSVSSNPSGCVRSAEAKPNDVGTIALAFALPVLAGLYVCQHLICYFSDRSEHSNRLLLASEHSDGGFAREQKVLVGGACELC